MHEAHHMVQFVPRAATDDYWSSTDRLTTCRSQDRGPVPMNSEANDKRIWRKVWREAVGQVVPRIRLAFLRIR